MRLTVGFHSVEDYPACVEAGADEVFCGYVPEEWMNLFGYSPMNRREVRYCNVQLGGESELRILSQMMQYYGIPVALTLNRPSYSPSAYAYLAEYIQRCEVLGFNRFIVADPGLLMYCFRRKLQSSVAFHISGEYGELNSIVIGQLMKSGAKRIIFPRHFSPTDMQLCAQAEGQGEYEAFLLNEKCHFHGAYCTTLHCDALPPFCRVPYRFNGKKTVEIREDESYEGLGAGGCGLCALWQLREAGVTHLKVVGRGNYSERILRDTRAAKQALTLLAQADCEESFQLSMKRMLFPEGCSGNCYYYGTV